MDRKHIKQKNHYRDIDSIDDKLLLVNDQSFGLVL